MRKQKQLFRHRPDEGIYGDCYRTAMACLLDLSPEEVPHVYDGVDAGGVPQMRAWLRERDLALVTTCWRGDLADVMSTIAQLNPDMLYLLTGQSSLGTGHVVVARNQEIIWDPSLDNTGIVGPHPDDGMFWVEFLAPALVLAA